MCVALGLLCAPGAYATRTDKPNQASQTPVASTPTFEPSGGVYLSNLTVRINGGGSELRYTLDGSEPKTNSPLYKEPIRVANTVRIRARAFAAGASSRIAGETYTLMEPELAAFSSGLPLLVVNTFGRDLSSEAKVAASLRFISTGTNGRAVITGDSDFDGRGLIRYRGFTSLRYPKKSLALDTMNEADKNLKVSILGFPEDSDWVLYAPYPDKTLIRDALAYELSNKIGRYAPRTRFIEVFFNSGTNRLTRSHYMGIYALEEKIKRSPDRVDIEKLGPQDNAEPAITGGYIFKKDHLEKVGLDEGEPPPRSRGYSSSSVPTGPGGFPANLGGFEESRVWPTTHLVGQRPAVGKLVSSTNGFVSSKGIPFFYVEPKAEEITAAQRTWLNDYVNRFEAALYGPDFRNPTNGYAAFIDVDSFIDHHLIVETTKNVDGFRFSTYFTKDRGGKLKLEPIWDWNLAFGNCRGKEGYLPQGWYWPQLDDYQYSWFRRLFEDPDFAQRYVDRWVQLRTHQFATANLLRRVDELAALLKEPAERNFKRWPILGETIVPNYHVGSTYAEEIAWMKNWIASRLAWIEKQFPPTPAVAVQASTNATVVALAAPAGKIFFTTDGSDPRLPGGSLSPKAQPYQVPVAAAGGAHIVARVQQDKRWSSPAGARVAPAPPAAKPKS
jgi:hypothetical protein